MSALYVATNGSDAWSGKMPAPNAAKTDGPFATVERAQQAVRAALSSDTSDASKAAQPKSIVVQVRGGFYPLAKTLTFTAADSDANGGSVVYEAFPGETPVLSGGTRIAAAWKRRDGNRWETTIPEVAAGKWYFEQLYVNGERRYRPRMPKTGYYYAADPLPNDGQPGIARLHYDGGDGLDGVDHTGIRADWHALADAEVLAFHKWEMSRFHVTGIDTTAQTVSFAGRSPEVEAGGRFLIENVREALSEPGQWYLDLASGVLTYLARPGENPNRETVVAPRVERLLEIDGASGLMFRGLTFADAAYALPPQGHSSPQADIDVGSAIHLSHARYCAFERCMVRNTGGYAIEMDRGCQNCRVAECLLTDLGAGGVRVGVTHDWKPDEPGPDKTVGDSVTDCRIVHGGRIHPAAVGVLVGNASYTTVAHNTIADFYYTAVSVGWSWGYGTSGAHHNAIAYNDIRQIGQGVLSDMGGIYTLGVSPGTVLDHNRIQDVVSCDYGGWGIYFDEGSTGIVARDNVVFHMKSDPFHQHYGTENVVENCILALGDEGQLRRSRGDNGPQATPAERADLSFTIRRCLVFSDGPPLFFSDWNGANFGLNDNLYWNADAHQPPTFPGNRTLAQWQAQGHDAGSVVADPLFRDPQHGDFTLRPGSPAAQIGFQPIDLRTVGPRVDFGSNLAAVSRAFPAPPPPLPPQPIHDDFERTVVGQKPGRSHPVVNEEADHPEAYIRVTDEAALSGRHSLKFQDAPGQRFSYSPHLFYQPGFKIGTMTGKFALRLEPGASFYHEWRDGSTPYRVGPSLFVGPDGTLTANGRQIAKLPLSQWTKFTVAFTLGGTGAANTTYALTLELPGEAAPRHFPDLPCGTLPSLDWWGFVANGTTKAAFYVDDVSLTAK